jgi:hypothetical protein
MQSRPSSIKAAQNDRISTMFDRLCTLWCKGTTETAPHISLSKDLNMIRRFLTLALAPLSIVATSPAFASDFTVSSPDMANGLGPVHTIFPRCVAEQNGHAQGANRSRGRPPARLRNAAIGIFGRNPKGMG